MSHSVVPTVVATHNTIIVNVPKIDGASAYVIQELNLDGTLKANILTNVNKVTTSTHVIFTWINREPITTYVLGVFVVVTHNGHEHGGTTGPFSITTKFPPIPAGGWKPQGYSKRPVLKPDYNSAIHDSKPEV